MADAAGPLPWPDSPWQGVQYCWNISLPDVTEVCFAETCLTVGVVCAAATIGKAIANKVTAKLIFLMSFLLRFCVEKLSIEKRISWSWKRTFQVQQLKDKLGSTDRPASLALYFRLSDLIGRTVDRLFLLTTGTALLYDACAR